MNYQELFDQQKAYFQTHLKQSTAKVRIAKLRKMKKWIFAHQEDLRKAVYEDFRKPAHEVDMTEMLPVIVELKDAIANLREWMRPKKVGAPMAMLTTSARVHYEPKGNSLILAPWNFPFMLTVSPMVSAVAAGCAMVIKPSEYAPATSAHIEKMIKSIFDPAEATLLHGDYRVAEALTALPFDHIFFTGSPQVGKKVMHAAAEHLASVTLELGGRNPVIVDDTANLKDAAKKLIWGKFLNAGQSCMSPNYIMVHEKVYDKFLALIQSTFQKMYPEHHGNMQQSPDFARVISERHLQRLAGLVDATVEAGAKILIAGDRDPSDNYLPPTILHDVPVDAPVMEDELFGPVMPIMKVRSLDDALS
ncbi:MAG: aldehyde dehydrogenase family protein, partial [Bacteroidota bacterium]